jgi:uncharacterized membrane protein (GlpM family)
MRKIIPLFIFVALALFIIAVHQTMVEGFRASYPFFMFSVFFYFYSGISNDPTMTLKTSSPTTRFVL